MTTIPFPSDFWWGTSLSAHQAEGGNVNSWTRFEENPGAIKNGERSGSAADHWNLFERDFENLAWLNGDTHRLSIEWSRVQPRKDHWDQSALDHYRKMIVSLTKRRIRPVVCLFHFTLPLWVSESGGFESGLNVTAFIKFAERVQNELGDLVHFWLTLNEPIVYALAAYAAGVTPPGLQNFTRCMNVIVNLLRAHGHVYHAIKNADPRAQVSFAQHMRVFAPKRSLSLVDRWGARIADDILNWSWFRTLETGRIKINIPGIFKADLEAPECLGALDFIGMNYYGRDFVRVKPLSKLKFHLSVPENVVKTDMNWEIYPEGIIEILHGIKKRGLGRFAILMTENGIADSRDLKRPFFIYDHLKMFLSGAAALDLKPMGYLYWSLIDNFEWVDGFGPRFGLFHVNYKTQERTPRGSARYFRAMGAKREVFPPSPA